MSDRPNTSNVTHRGGLIYRRHQRRSRRARGEYIECCPLWEWLVGGREYRRSYRRQRDSLSRRLEELGRYPRSPSESDRSRRTPQGHRRRSSRRESSNESQPSSAVGRERSSRKRRNGSSARSEERHREGMDGQQTRADGTIKDLNVHLLRRRKKGQSERVEEQIKVSIKGF